MTDPERQHNDAQQEIDEGSTSLMRDSLAAIPRLQRELVDAEGVFEVAEEALEVAYEEYSTEKQRLKEALGVLPSGSKLHIRAVCDPEKNVHLGRTLGVADRAASDEIGLSYTKDNPYISGPDAYDFTLSKNNIMTTEIVSTKDGSVALRFVLQRQLGESLGPYAMHILDVNLDESTYIKVIAPDQTLSST